MSSFRDQIEALCNTDSVEPIAPELYLPIITSPPFLPSKSLPNLRDLGLVPGSALPQSRFYRCGTLEAAGDDPDALAWLSTNVKRIIDLRTASERSRHPDPVIDGVENVWFEQQGEYPDPKVEEFVEDDGRTAWKRQLMAIVATYRPTFRAVLEQIRDRPTEPILFHCTGESIHLLPLFEDGIK